jgi:hypothetical protein
VWWTARTAAGREVLRGLRNGYVICVRVSIDVLFFSMEQSRRGLLVCSHQRCNRSQLLDRSIEGLRLVGWDALALLK